MKDALRRATFSMFSEEVFRQAVWEVKLNLRALAASAAPSQRRLISRLHRERPDDLKVNLGCGPLPTPGWLNIDGVSSRADLLQRFGRRLDLPDACARFVFCEHVLEHIDYPGPARVFLREIARILRPGGRLRIIVPDAERVIVAYLDRDLELLRRCAPSERPGIESVNRVFREAGFHRFAWDFRLLEAELREAGLEQIRRAQYRDSAEPELNIDFDEDERRAQSLYVEAVRP